MRACVTDSPASRSSLIGHAWLRVSYYSSSPEAFKSRARQGHALGGRVTVLLFVRCHFCCSLTEPSTNIGTINYFNLSDT